jgi:hypothetical protein
MTTEPTRADFEAVKLFAENVERANPGVTGDPDAMRDAYMAALGKLDKDDPFHAVFARVIRARSVAEVAFLYHHMPSGRAN